MGTERKICGMRESERDDFGMRESERDDFGWKEPKLKICGLMRPEDVSMCCRRGVDICGFVTEYPLTVPWNLTGNQCAELLRHISGPTQSCIVTGGEREKIISLALALRPDYVQLHYKETLEDVEAMVPALTPYNIKIIKTIPESEEERYQQFGTVDTELCVRKLCDAGVSVLLVDARGPENAASGGAANTAPGVSANADSGRAAANLRFYRRVKAAADCPVMLGGGITPDNCAKVITEVRPDILDVMTGVETAPGFKSEELVSRLIECTANIK